MEKQESVYKFTLSTGKTVLIREMKIEYQELAAKAAAPRAGDNAMVMAVCMQKELVKILIAGVDDKVLSGADKENLNALFTYQEYAQVGQAVKKVIGDEQDEGKLVMEIVPFGSK